MANSVTSQYQINTTDKVFDLNQIITDWAWSQYRDTSTTKMTLARLFGNVQISIDLADIIFTNTTTWQKDNNDNTNNGDKDKDATVKPVTVYETQYSNKSPTAQNHNLQVQKSTRSSCDVTIEKSYTHGFEVSIELPLEFIEFNSSFSREETLSTSNSQSYEEEIAWNLDSSISVKEFHSADIKLIVQEKNYTIPFEISSTMSGRVKVTFANKKNQFLKKIGGDINAIITQHIRKKKENGETPYSFIEINKENNKDIITILTKGKASMKYGVKQIVDIVQIPIPKEELTACKSN